LGAHDKAWGRETPQLTFEGLLQSLGPRRADQQKRDVGAVEEVSDLTLVAAQIEPHLLEVLEEAFALGGYTPDGRG
jgi:hypothetical protein